MKEPVDHIARPILPWRSEAAQTECGINAASVKIITRGEYVARKKEMGLQRCMMFTCMTCAETATRYGTWEDDPRKALEREINWEAQGYRWGREDRGVRLRDELLAIAALIEAHRDEFEESITATEQRREWLEKKANMKPKPQPQRPLGLL